MKVFVTGLGVVSGIGIGVDQNIASLKAGRSGMGQVTLFPTALDVPVSEVKCSNEVLKELLDLDPKCTYSRTALLGMLAAKEAWEDAKGNSPAWREYIGIISATSVGGMDMSEHFYESFKQNPRKGRLREIVGHDCSASTELIADYLDIKGKKATISTACSSAANAIMRGAELIRTGKLDTVIVGGTDALCRFTLNGFNSLMILDKEHCRPFDESRTGLNLGEGAGYLVLQSEKSCKRTPYCELTGYANANEAFHQTGSSAEGDGPFLSMKQAIAMSKIAPQEVGYISTHGTGTPSNDASESRALQRIFGEHVPPFSSVKPFIGHTLGASGGIEAVYSVLSLQNGCAYPNLNFFQPIAATGLVPQINYQEGLSIKHVVCNSFGFGGNDASLVFSAVNPEKREKRINKKKLTFSPVYINSLASIHAEGANEGSPYLTAQEPDYKSIITDANLRRRMNRMVKMGVACGLECLGDTSPKKIQGIITATGWGFLADTEKFMNAIIDQKEQSLNPTPFIQSTFNTIGAQIALLRGIQTYNMTYVHRGSSFESALEDALVKTRERKGSILVGAVDECTPTSYTIQQRLGMLRGIQAGEGAQFFLLDNQPNNETAAELCACFTYPMSDDEVDNIEIKEEWAVDDTRMKNLLFIASIFPIYVVLEARGLTLDDIDWVVIGENKKQNKFCERLKACFPNTVHSSFKDECGEYPTASSYALWKVVNAFKDPNHPAKVALIYNCYQPGIHSFIIVRKHQP